MHTYCCTQCCRNRTLPRSLSSNFKATAPEAQSEEAMRAAEQGGELYCLCRQPYDEARFYVASFPASFP